MNRMLYTLPKNKPARKGISDKNIKNVAFLHYEMAFQHLHGFGLKRIIKESKDGLTFVYFDK